MQPYLLGYSEPLSVAKQRTSRLTSLQRVIIMLLSEGEEWSVDEAMCNTPTSPCLNCESNSLVVAMCIYETGFLASPPP